MIAKIGLAALLGTVGTAAMASPASAAEWRGGRQEHAVRGYDRGFERGRVEHQREWREHQRWMRFHHGRRGWYGSRY